MMQRPATSMLRRVPTSPLSVLTSPLSVLTSPLSALMPRACIHQQTLQQQLPLLRMRPCLQAVTPQQAVTPPQQTTRHLSVSHNRRARNVSADHVLRSPVPDIQLSRDSFHEFVFKRCDKYKGKVALEEHLTGKTLTYGDLKASAVRVASRLHSLGFKKGDVVLIHSVNCIDLAVLLLACSVIGVVFSPSNPTFTPEELAIQLRHCGPVAVVTHSALHETMTKALELGNVTQITHKFAFGDSPGYQPFETLQTGSTSPLPDVTFDPLEDILIMPYSSGTTGLPKGVMLTHHNCTSNMLQGFVSGSPTYESDVIMGMLPMYNISGLINYHLALYGGAKLVFLPQFRPDVFLQCIQEKQITLLPLVPPLVVFLAKHPMVDGFDISSVDRVMVGAAPLGADITLAFKERHNIDHISQVYGMTETSPFTNIDTSMTPGCAGYMVANTLGKIVGLDTGATMGSGEQGEVWVKGPQVMKGYLHNQAATDAIVADGWLKTGDIGIYDEDGKIFINDRLKELIKYKGSQVAPAELEALLLGHPDVQDAAVIGQPDEAAGELPVAFVVSRPGSEVREAEIVTFVAERVAKAKQLRGGVRFISEIPKNPSGKILRRVLKSEYL